MARIALFVRRTIFVDFIVRCTYTNGCQGAGTSRQSVYTCSLGKDSMMVKVEDIQNYGKEHLDSVAASASNVQSGVQAIATAYGDYAKKSFEDTKSFVEKLSGVKSIEFLR